MNENMYCVKCEETVEKRETKIIWSEDDHRIIPNKEDWQSYPREHIGCGGKIVSANS